MRKFSVLLSVLVLATMILAACGGEETSTNIPVTNVPPATIDVTTTSEAGSSTATEVPSESITTETPGIPVTGETNPARLSNELDFTVLGQDASQIGDVDDMVLDLDNARISYVVVGASGREVLVPWDSLTLQASTSGGQQNAFILQADQETFNNAPAFDLSKLPKMGQPADDWDAQISSYWQSGGTGTGLDTPTVGTGTGLATSTPSTGLATSTPTGTGSTGLATATAGTGTGLATATASTGTGTGTTILQGVVLASDVLGSTVTLGKSTSTGTGTGLATATAGVGTSLATSTPGTGTGLATATLGTGKGLATPTAGAGTVTAEGTMAATVEDMIVDTTTGDIIYIVLNANSGNDQLIPVPLSMFGWDSNAQGFVLNADATMLQNAPIFPSDQFPDTTASGWNSQFDAFWQNNGSGGSGTATQATATATP
jgi:sporulation protein YlmC with PRC-barrel domain